MLEMGLFWLGVLMVVVAYLILLFDTFRQNKIWAIAGMILIIPLLAHAMMNWTTLNVRKALYAFIIGVLAILVSIAGGALAHLPILQEHEVVQTLEENIAPPKVEPLPNEEQAKTTSLANQEDYDPLLSGSEYEDLEVKEMAAKVKKNVVNTTPSSRYQSITREELKYAVNKQIRITLQDTEVVIGKLTNIEEDGVLVESSVNGGILGLSYSHENIKAMEVLLLNGEPLVSEEQLIEEEVPTDQGEQIESAQPQPEALMPVEVPEEQESMVEEVVEPVVETMEEVDAVDSIESAETTVDAIEEISQEIPDTDNTLVE